MSRCHPLIAIRLLLAVLLTSSVCLVLVWTDGLASYRSSCYACGHATGFMPTIGKQVSLSARDLTVGDRGLGLSCFKLSEVSGVRPGQLLRWQDDTAEAIQRGREALREAASFPWYDERDDAVRSVDVDEGSPGAKHRDSDWVAPEKQPRQSNRKMPSTAMSNISNTILNVLVWGTIAIILIGLIAFLVWAFMRHETAQDQDDLEEWLDDSRTDEQRIEDLPFEIKRPTSDLFAAAERARLQGDRRLAVIYLFSHMLVQMDRNHRIRLAKGKTNRQYLNEIVSLERLHGIVNQSMLVFERVFFGGHDLDEGEFEAVWSSVGDFETHVRPTR